jgi:hypothetical protein
MDWTFLILSSGVVALAAFLIPNTPRTLLPEVGWRTTGFGAAFLALLYMEGTTWEAYELLIGFLFGMSVWIILNREDD